jgi:hypothetical protein
MIFNADWSYNTTILNSGELISPQYLAIYEDGLTRELVVADREGTSDARIQVFDMDDNYNLLLTIKGSGISEIMRVNSVEVDAEKRIYVVDSNLRQVRAFDGSNGDYLGVIYEDPYQLNVAKGMTLGRDNILHIVTNGAREIERYQLLMTAGDIDVQPSSHDFGEVDVGNNNNHSASSIYSSRCIRQLQRSNTVKP